ncbi:DUF4822 domain-containing protein [Erysipelothrix sp. HDW6C]|uniref:DUF4822 domain-containing protein n=1 Tax=Erysipelothrix sp. HDW6C TaxID=2714930 RepID=UPI0014097EB6|nr:DUF4822 domain-containing protein [Erysipelothrix sp. HDW6C]QIK70674.1 DUF4822 domain-containing protein [Erysipelothrix sp. HDW6C]
MKNSRIKFFASFIIASVVLVGCAAKQTEGETEKPQVSETHQTKGQEYTNILTSTAWQGTRAYDKENNDLSEENAGFLGLALYDFESGKYEFFDKDSGETRGDEGTFFITQDGEKRILISQTKGYQVVVDLTELTDEIFTYKRMGKDKEGKDVEVYVEHIPYKERELVFTNAPVEDTTYSDKIEQDVRGIDILGQTLWNGTKVFDENGVDVTEENKMFISIAKFDETNNKYEFFDVATGLSRGDYGYFDIINNRVRAHVSIGEKPYGAVLTLTELNNARFTYTRMGKDKDGNEIKVFVEHEPYTGEFTPTFSF